jgi:hypothetical protein
MPTTETYTKIVVTTFDKGKIDEKECWMAVQRLALDQKFQKGTRVWFNERGVIRWGKVVGFGKEWEGGWPRLLVEGKGGKPDFDLITSPVYTSLSKGIFTTIRRCISSPLLRDTGSYNGMKIRDIKRDVENKCNKPSYPVRSSWSLDMERGSVPDDSSTASVGNIN